jgi:hypothetical protein
MEVAMAKARNLVLGVGCLLVLLGAVIAILIAYGMSSPSPPKQVARRQLSGPIPELCAEIPSPASAAALRSACASSTPRSAKRRTTSGWSG